MTHQGYLHAVGTSENVTTPQNGRGPKNFASRTTKPTPFYKIPAYPPSSPHNACVASDITVDTEYNTIANTKQEMLYPIYNMQ